MPWSPSQYLRFGDHRTRPAAELLARVPLEAPQRVADLGCGPGNSTALLVERFPDAEVVAVDNDAAMLERARAAVPSIEVLEGDLNTWEPEGFELLYANAAFHWIGEHRARFRSFLERLPEGGALAVQMPRNHGAPSHRSLAELARSERWRDRVGHLVKDAPVAEPAVYHRDLAPLASHVDVWECDYYQVLEGDDPVLEWVRGTTLVPYRAALDEGDRDAFEAEYAALLREAYPREVDGTTLFAFRRVFLVAVR